MRQSSRQTAAWRIKQRLISLPVDGIPGQLPAKEGPVDTSATAMILYAISRSLNTKVLIGIHKSRMLRGLEALQSIVTDGEVPNALAECQGFGMYPQVYGGYPWSLGPALSLFVMNEDQKEGTI